MYLTHQTRGSSDGRNPLFPLDVISKHCCLSLGLTSDAITCPKDAQGPIVRPI